MICDAVDFLDVGRVALAEDEGDEGPSIVTPGDSVRRPPLNDVMEARKVDCIAIWGWVTLRLLNAEIGS